MPIPQPKPTDRPGEFEAAGACPAGGGVSEPTHSIALREKQPRRAGMERAGGGKKTKTETELGGREGVLVFHPQVSQGREEECFPLNPLGLEPRMHPQPEPPGGLPSPLKAQAYTIPASSAAVAHRIDPCSAGSSKCRSFGGRAAGRWGGGSGGGCPQFCSLHHPGELCKLVSSAQQQQRKQATTYHETWQQHIRCFPPTQDKSAFISQLSGQEVPLQTMTVLAAESREREACHGQDLQWLFVMGFEEAASPGKQNRFGLQAEQRPKSSQEQSSGDLSVRKSPAPPEPLNLDVRTGSPARTQVKEREPFSECSWGRCRWQMC